jgi:hypothetical protein
MTGEVGMNGRQMEQFLGIKEQYVKAVKREHLTWTGLNPFSR